jgi:putative Flp pilus-assembly TadE/G-like protein
MLRGRGGSERGSVAITVALALTVLLGLAALVVDVGLNWAARTSAQTAADSAALAGASSLLVDGPAGAIATVEDLLKDNLVTPVGANWALDGLEDNGEVVCWTLPAPPPDTLPLPQFRCPEGSNALRVITPPIKVQYAFAPVLGKRSNSIKAMAAAGAGPMAPNNCVLCVLDPAESGAMLLATTNVGGIELPRGGIVVNSESSSALNLLGGGTIDADQLRVLGGVAPPDRLGQLLVSAERGGPPAVDPLGDLPTPNQLVPPPPPVNTATDTVINGDTTLQPGIYRSIDVVSGTLTLEEGVYVVTNTSPFNAAHPGFSVRAGAHVVSSGDGAAIHLACSGYPAPCSGRGARLLLADGGDFQVDPPATGPYAGLSIFSAPGNTRSLQLLGGVTLAGAVYAPSARLVVNSPDQVQVDALVAVDQLTKNGTGLFQVNYDLASPLIAIGRPVLLS